MLTSRKSKEYLAPTQNYETTHGLLLLSKHELRNKAIHTYHLDHVALITRGYLAAEVRRLSNCIPDLILIPV